MLGRIWCLDFKLMSFRLRLAIALFSLTLYFMMLLPLLPLIEDSVAGWMDAYLDDYLAEEDTAHTADYTSSLILAVRIVFVVAPIAITWMTLFR